MDLYNLSVAFDLYDLMIVVYMFAAALLWLLRGDKSNGSFSQIRPLMCFRLFELSTVCSFTCCKNHDSFAKRGRSTRLLGKVRIDSFPGIKREMFHICIINKRYLWMLSNRFLSVIATCNFQGHQAIAGQVIVPSGTHAKIFQCIHSLNFRLTVQMKSRA